jgi:hypothetical protein
MICASQFYFSSNEDVEGSSRVMEAINISYTKHFGSIVIGSLIHTVLGFLRMIVEMFEKAARKDGDCNIFIIIIACCLSCIVSAIS